MCTSARLDALDLGKRFGARILFRRLDLSIKAGESLAITGANGAGKSTLVRILAGVLTPSRGEVHLREHETLIPRDRHPLHVGLVGPYLNIYEGFSARENLRFIGRARRLPDIRTRIEETLGLVGLSDRMDEPVSTFSSGMKQRVKIAAALLSQPTVLLLDEPGANLDAAGIAMVDEVAARHLDRNGILIIATNDREEADRYDGIIKVEDFR